MKIADIAMICHEANRAYQYVIGQEVSPAWRDAPQWQADSAIAGVQAVVWGTATSPEEQWRTWKEHKLSEGWKYGPVKNAETKEHPCIVDTYDQLPIDEQRKDRLFRGIVTALTEQ